MRNRDELYLSVFYDDSTEDKENCKLTFMFSQLAISPGLTTFKQYNLIRVSDNKKELSDSKTKLKHIYKAIQLVMTVFDYVFPQFGFSKFRLIDSNTVLNQFNLILLILEQ